MMMRTTLNLSDKAYYAIKSFAETHSCSLSEAASLIFEQDFANGSKRHRLVHDPDTGFTLFDPGEPVTEAMIKELLDEE